MKRRSFVKNSSFTVGSALLVSGLLSTQGFADDSTEIGPATCTKALADPKHPKLQSDCSPKTGNEKEGDTKVCTAKANLSDGQQHNCTKTTCKWVPGTAKETNGWMISSVEEC
jgi:hypothetical protein